MIIQDLYESPQTCPECGGPSFSDLILAEKKDACYHKVKASAKVWPSAYASGRLVQCRKKGADNYGNKSESMSEDSKESYMIIRTDAEGKKDVFAGNFDTYEQAQKELDACLAHPLHTKYKQKFEIKRKGGDQGVAEAFGPLPRERQQIRLGRHTVDIERVSLDKNYISFAWNDSQGQEHYEEVAVGDLGSYDDLIGRIKQEISYQERQYTDQGVAEGSESDAYGNTGEKHECGSCDGTGIDTHDDECPECGGKGWVRDKESLKKKGMAEDQLDEKSTSQAQFRTMAAAAHNPKFAKKVGISRDVAREFHGADRKQDYADLPKKADESKSAPKEKEADYGDDYQAMVARVKKLAGLGPLKTVYDPAKRVYRNMPTAQQPKK